ncbi:glycoside hydrolase family 32 protein [Rhizobium lentis]|uniref:GH32 C-terminal domain-containing protein n=1 Tax=Rhizobium lentis TaxID=1138194 RepID=UPI001C82961E|nr:GH32 C-terminal domain-containing protein [Rhizobium lentis]MBX5043928.1 glycoside hydrolase family 32 protein [Rhizobium lentis]MBX5056813.1 glycoside hydrolase family 32 protein [Rhizobium lentis]MBX5074870.1 glycoside hydrolase family 32 protein [Rhizobium lentis]MBX5112257.1 glycoside hydrolase family 32 protein [Rhizobium lentis]MBX5118314.1 glycoside hydrolase family 32 protein [Rhizobium lentis]
MRRQKKQLELGTRIEFWARSIDEKADEFPFRILDQGKQVLWAVKRFSEFPEFYSYHHREACEVELEWNEGVTDFTWAYAYNPRSVSKTGITVLEFGEHLVERTGPEIDAWCASDPQRPRLHFSPVKHWMNDPNGLCKIGDVWHLFYQFHPAGTDWGPMHWGHATSRNLCEWLHMPVFLHPEQNLARLGATGGAFSGSAFRGRDGKVKFYYTERLPAYDLFAGYREIQKIAEPGRDLIEPERITTVLEVRPEGVEHDFRDPKVWWDGAARAYRMILGASIDGDPAVLLYGSGDGLEWQYLGPLYRAPARFRAEGARAVECPDFFRLEDKWVLVMGFVGHIEPTTGRHNLLYALIGEFAGDRFVPDAPELQLLDFGTDYYAMQSFEAEGRQIAFAWLFNWEYRKPEGSAYSGEMSLPRVLSLNEDKIKICMLPAIEVDERYVAIPVAPDRSGDYALPSAPIEIRLSGPLQGSKLVATEGGELAFEVSVAGDILSIRLAQDDGSIRYVAELGGGKDLRLFHDRGIVEIFADGGAVCGTRRGYANIEPDRLEISSSASAQVFEKLAK